MENQSIAILLSEAAKIEQILIESGGELTPAIEAQIDQTFGMIENKVDAFAFMMRYFKSRAAFWNDEEAACYKSKKGCQNIEKGMNSYLKRVMLYHNLKVITGDTDKFSMSENEHRLEVFAPKMVPAKYCDEAFVLVPNNALIRAALEAGEIVPGAKLIPSQTLRPSKATRGKPKKGEEPAQPMPKVIDVKFLETKSTGVKNEPGTTSETPTDPISDPEIRDDAGAS